MKATVKTLIAAALAGAALMTAVPASAGGDWDGDGHREWRGGHHHHHRHDHHRHHHKHWSSHHYEERVIVRERPVYYPAPASYYAPPPRYYPRNPAIVVGVDIPPLVIPLR